MAHFGEMHYGMSQDEARAKYNSTGDFEGPLPLCGNGSFHCPITKNKGKVTCKLCLEKLKNGSIG